MNLVFSSIHKAASSAGSTSSQQCNFWRFSRGHTGYCNSHVRPANATGPTLVGPVIFAAIGVTTNASTRRKSLRCLTPDN